MIAPIIYRDERAAESTSSLSKALKFISAASDFAPKFFNGLEAAAAIGSLSPPLKKAVDCIEAFSFIDILNNVIYDPNNWVKTASKIIILAAAILAPIALASSFGFFSLGFLGANIALYGTLSIMNATRNGLGLSSILLNMYDRHRNPTNEAAEARFAKAQWEQIVEIQKFRNGDIPTDVAEVRFRDIAEKVNTAVNLTTTQWTTLSQQAPFHYLQQMAEFKKLQYEVKELKLRKAELTNKDELVKLVTTSLSVAGYFVLNGVITSMVAYSALCLYSAYLGWEKGDIELLATKKGVDLHNYYTANNVILTSIAV